MSAPHDRNTGKETPEKPQGNRATAADLMAGGMNDAEVASVIGVHASTVTRWRHRPEMTAEIQRIQRNASQGARARLAHCVHGALDVLMDLAQGVNVDSEVRLKAAIAVVDKGLPAMGAVPTTVVSVGLTQNVSIEEAKALVRENRKGVIDV